MSQAPSTGYSPALSITAEVAVFLLEQRVTAPIFDLAGKVLSAAAYADACVLALSQSSASGNFSFVVPRECSQRVHGCLRQHLWEDMKRGDIHAPRLIDEVVMITLQGRHPDTACVYEQLAAHNLNILLISHAGSSLTLIVQASLAQAQVALRPVGLEASHPITIPQ